MAKTFAYTVVARTGRLRSDGTLDLDEEAIKAEVHALQRDGWEIASTAMASQAQGPPWRPSHTLRLTYYLKRPVEDNSYRTASRKR